MYFSKIFMLASIFLGIGFGIGYHTASYFSLRNKSAQISTIVDTPSTEI